MVGKRLGSHFAMDVVKRDAYKQMVVELLQPRRVAATWSGTSGMRSDVVYLIMADAGCGKKGFCN